MIDNYYFDLLVLVIIGFLSGAALIFDAFRIQKKKGVVTELKTTYTVLLMGSTLQFIQLLNLIEASPYLWYGMLACFLIISLLIIMYFRGRNIYIYEAEKGSVVSYFEEELQHLSIAYEKKESMVSEDTIFKMKDHQVMIRVEPGLLGEEIKMYKVSFKRWWRSPIIEEIQYKLFDELRQQREGKIFWKQIIINSMAGMAIILVTLVILWYFL